MDDDDKYLMLLVLLLSVSRVYNIIKKHL